MLDTFTEIFFVVVSIFTLTFSEMTRPTRATCPKGWSLALGIRVDGTFACRPAIVGGDDDVLTGGTTSVQPPGTIYRRIYCTGGSLPVINASGLTVGCQRGGWVQ